MLENLLFPSKVGRLAACAPVLVYNFKSCVCLLKSNYDRFSVPIFQILIHSWGTYA